MPIVALDRDGVINVDSPHYIKSKGEWEPLPGSIEAIKALNDKGYRVYVATNQAGLARGLFQQSDLDEMHSKLESLVEAEGGHVSGIKYCPHHPDEKCQCRKPMPGLLRQIERASGESMKNQCFVGDSLKDIQAAMSIGAKPILVLTGNGRSTQSKLKERSVDVETYDTLLDFAKAIATT